MWDKRESVLGSAPAGGAVLGRVQRSYPEEGGEALAVVPHGKVLWLGPHGVHDVLKELGLLLLWMTSGGES